MLVGFGPGGSLYRLMLSGTNSLSARKVRRPITEKGVNQNTKTAVANFIKLRILIIPYYSSFPRISIIFQHYKTFVKSLKQTFSQFFIFLILLKLYISVLRIISPYSHIFSQFIRIFSPFSVF